MTTKTSYPPGDFCWTELATSDWRAASQFYESLFGWTANPMPMAPDQPPYVMLQNDGKNVCALYENQKAQPSWLSYVAVAKVDDGAQKAKSLGAQLLSEPFDVLDVGRMANIRDPQGARFAIWEARRQKGADVINEPNTMCWNELSSNDIDASRKFYSELFGWQFKETPGYTEVHLADGTAVGGMHDMMKTMPPFWMPYFAVDACDAAANRAQSLGATVYSEPSDIEKVGRFAILADPQRATFAIIQLAVSS